MKVKISPKSIDQWYKCTTNLYIYWRGALRQHEYLNLPLGWQFSGFT